jgi:hypothetical protein
MGWRCTGTEYVLVLYRSIAHVGILGCLPLARLAGIGKTIVRLMLSRRGTIAVALAAGRTKSRPMKKTLIIATASLCMASAPAIAQAPADIDARMVEQRAVEAVIWGMPAVNTDLMLQAALKLGAHENEIVYWSHPVDWHNQTLTPNPDTIYLMPFFNTKDGPVVLEVPPADGASSVTGNIDDVWQMPLEDAGPSGADKGAGGKYLIVPPGYSGTVPDGYIVLRAATYSGYALIRSNLPTHENADIAKAVAYGKRLKIYALGDAGNPPPTKFTDAADVLFDSTIPYDFRFFESLNRIVQSEPWQERDKAMIDPLRMLGIEKSKPFNPDETTKLALSGAVREAHAWLDHRLETAFAPYFDGTHWAVPAAPELVQTAANGYADPNIYPVDARAITYSIGYVGIKHLGGGQFYLMSAKDKDGNSLDGGDRYRLAVPANAPMQQYWSVTAYSRDTHALIKDVSHGSRSSQAVEIQKNADGSVDIFFGPEAPGGKESNWVPTRRGEKFELLFRLYAPTKPLFDKTWTMPDVEKTN